MSATYRATCDDCGAVSPEYARQLPGRLNHDCERACLHDGYRRQGVGTRGLCAQCYRDPEVRADYPMAYRRGTDLIEDVEWLLVDGASLKTALARLDIKNDTLWKALDRAGRRDLFDRLADREHNAALRQSVRETLRRRAS